MEVLRPRGSTGVLSAGHAASPELPEGTEHETPAPAVGFTGPAPETKCTSTSPAAACVAPASRIEYVTPAPDVDCTVPAPVTEYVDTSPAVTFAEPAVTDTAPAPASEYAAPVLAPLQYEPQWSSIRRLSLWGNTGLQRQLRRQSSC